MFNWLKLFRHSWTEAQVREHVLRTACLHFFPVEPSTHREHHFIHVSMEYQPRQFSGDNVLSVHFSVPPWARVLDLREEGAACVEQIVRTTLFIETEGLFAYRRETSWLARTEKRR